MKNQMSGTMVLWTSVKCDGKIRTRWSVVEKDDEFYNLLKPYLVPEEEYTKWRTSTVRVLDTVRESKSESDVDDIPAVNKISNPKKENTDDADEDTRTKSDIMAELDAKGITYDSRAKKSDLLALLEAE